MKRLVDVPKGATLGGRSLEARGLGKVTEVITEFDRDTMQLTYRPDNPQRCETSPTAGR